MKRIAKIFLALLLVLVGLAAVAITFTVGWRPVIGPKARPLTTRVFDRTPQRLERCRSLPPVRNPLPPTEMIFHVKYLIRGVPKQLTSPVPEILVTFDPIKRGEYLVRLAGCGNCHAPQIRGQELPGMDFAGGFTRPGPSCV